MRKHGKENETNFNYGVCGANFCPDTELSSAAVPHINQVYLLILVMAINTALSVFFGTLLNDIDILRKENEKFDFKAIGFKNSFILVIF